MFSAVVVTGVELTKTHRAHWRPAEATACPLRQPRLPPAALSLPELFMDARGPVPLNLQTGSQGVITPALPPRRWGAFHPSACHRLP